MNSNTMKLASNPVNGGLSHAVSRSERSLARDALIRLAVALLRPIIRMLLRYNLSYPEMNQICRWLYVDVAMREREFYIPRRKRQFKARVACLTGLSRKEVLRLHQNPPPELNGDLEPFNRAARVLAGWLADPAFRNTHGEPATLKFRNKAGVHDFSDLVQAYSGDIPPRAVLDELLRAGNCRMDEDGWIEVVDNVYVTRPISPAALAQAAERGTSVLNEIDEMLRSDEFHPDAAIPGRDVNQTVAEMPEKAIATA